MKALVGAFNQEKALVGAFSVIVQFRRLIFCSANLDAHILPVLGLRVLGAGPAAAPHGPRLLPPHVLLGAAARPRLGPGLHTPPGPAVMRLPGLCGLYRFSQILLWFTQRSGVKQNSALSKEGRVKLIFLRSNRTSINCIYLDY